VKKEKVTKIHTGEPYCDLKESWSDKGSGEDHLYYGVTREELDQVNELKRAYLAQLDELLAHHRIEIERRTFSRRTFPKRVPE
jgi:hypothetical protein